MPAVPVAEPDAGTFILNPEPAPGFRCGDSRSSCDVGGSISRPDPFQISPWHRRALCVLYALSLPGFPTYLPASSSKRGWDVECIPGGEPVVALPSARLDGG